MSDRSGGTPDYLTRSNGRLIYPTAPCHVSVRRSSGASGGTLGGPVHHSECKFQPTFPTTI
jgi:hypothetical protein